MDQQFKCSQCGLDFPASEIITYENHYVCAGCKPIFVQRLREGVTLSATTKFAGFWIRFGAKIIDGIITWIVMAIISFIVYKIYPQPHFTPGTKHMELGTGYYLNLIFSVTLSIGYYVWFVGTYGATIGKMGCGIKIIMADGSKVSYGRALGRAFSEFLSGIICYIGYIMAGSDKEKRALHDRICNTRVVYK